MQNQFQTPAPPAEATTCIVPPAETAEPETTQTLPNAQTITDLLAQTHRKIRSRNKRFWGAIATLFAVYTATMFIRSVFKLDALNAVVMIILVLFTGVGVVLAGVAVRNSSLPTGIDFAELARIGGRQSVPALQEAARNSGVPVDVVSCQSALTACLPQLQATDAALLTAHDRRYLNEVLSRLGTHPECQPAHTAYALAILKAYEQVGDAKAISVVERLAKMKTHNQHQEKLKQAAQECLPLLRAHISNSEPEQTLLRASAPNVGAPDMLLRAAGPDTNAPEGELLRAAERNAAPPSP